jgi:hypothetical protein
MAITFLYSSILLREMNLAVKRTRQISMRQAGKQMRLAEQPLRSPAPCALAEK